MFIFCPFVELNKNANNIFIYSYIQFINTFDCRYQLNDVDYTFDGMTGGIDDDDEDEDTSHKDVSPFS